MMMHRKKQKISEADYQAHYAYRGYVPPVALAPLTPGTSWLTQEWIVPAHPLHAAMVHDLTHHSRTPAMRDLVLWHYGDVA
jgi:hypothetical protein